MKKRTDLSVTIAGIRFPNPVLTASGTFGYGDEIGDLVPLKELGGIITKTITLRPRPGNKPPRLAEVSSGMLNSIGLQNVGVERFLSEKWSALRKLPVPVIVSVAGETAEDYIGVVRQLNAVKGVAAVELNLSCPNLQKKIICQDIDLVRCIVSGTVKAGKFPVFAKLSPQVADIGGLALEAQNAGAAAVSLVNTFPGMAIDIKTWKPKLSTVSGGMSGPAVKPLALRCVWEGFKKVSIPVIGGGGITTAADAVEFMLAGSTALSVGTANFGDPMAPVLIARGLDEYCSARGMAAVAGLIGQLRI